MKRTLSRTLLYLSIIMTAALAVMAQSGRRPDEKDAKSPEQKSSAPSTEKGDELTDDVVRVETNLINIPVAVMDRDGKFITDLHREDFRVYEDGVEQQLAFFAPVEQPFTVVLLLDTSPSTKFRLKDIQDAAIAFLDQLRPEDRAVGVTFNSQLHVLNRMLRDREGLRKAIRQIKSAPGTYLYATVDVMLNKLFRKIPGRKALVVFTDGVDNLFIPPNDTQRRATFTSNMRDAQESGVIIYPIQYNTIGEMLRAGGIEPEQLLKDYRLATAYLAGLAGKTGGRVYRADDLDSLSQAFTSIAEDLRRQYSLGYYPKKVSTDGHERRIKVRVNRANVVIQSRESYSSPPPENSPQ